MFRLTSASLGLSDFPSLTLLLCQIACALLEVRSSVAQLAVFQDRVAGLCGWLQPALGRGADVLVSSTGLGHLALS